MPIINQLIEIQKRENMNDTEFAKTLGYHNRVSWQRIKKRRFPVNEKLMYRAMKRWPEIKIFLPVEATKDSQEVTQSNPHNPQNQNPGVLRRALKRLFNHP